MKSLRSNANAATLALIALLVLGVAFISPFITIRVELLGVNKTYSLIGGIINLFAHGNIFLGAILLIFRVLFPTSKLLMLIVCTSRFMPISWKSRIRMHHLVALSAKYSMLDIFVVAIMIVAFKIGHLANVSGLAGIYIFTGANCSVHRSGKNRGYIFFERRRP